MQKAYDNALRAAEDWAARMPGDPHAARAVANAHDKLGTQANTTMNSAAVADHYQKAADIRRKLSERFPTDTQIQREWSISLNKLGDIELVAGNSATAFDRYKESLKNRVEALTPGQDPVERLADIRFCNTKLCEACLALDDLEAAGHCASSHSCGTGAGEG